MKRMSGIGTDARGREAYARAMREVAYRAFPAEREAKATAATPGVVHYKPINKSNKDRHAGGAHGGACLRLCSGDRLRIDYADHVGLGGCAVETALRSSRSGERKRIPQASCSRKRIANALVRAR